MGIPHIENLHPMEFYEVVTDLTGFIASIKYDGANIVFGQDQHGWYSSRELKSGQRYYDEAEYPIKFWTSWARSAHLAAQHFQITGQAEVLFGRTPNVIQYDGRNRIICFDPNPHCGKNVTVNLKVPKTDGYTIWTEDEEHEWTIEALEYFILEDIRDEYKSELEVFKQYLYRPSGIRGKTNLEILDFESKDKNVRELVELQRKIINDELMPIKLAIKKYLLDFVPDGDEGIVLKNPRIVTKIVDRDGFTKANIDAHRVREKINGRMFGKYKPKTIMARGSIALLDRYQSRYMRQPYENPDIHQRTLQHFAEAREELTHAGHRYDQGLSGSSRDNPTQGVVHAQDHRTHTVASYDEQDARTTGLSTRGTEAHVQDQIPPRRAQADRSQPSCGVVLLRGQPVHRGHEVIIKRAMEENEHHQVVLIHGAQSSKDKRKNPLDWNIRLRLLQAITPNASVHANPYDALMELSSNYTKIKLYCGSDRDYTQIIDRLNTSVEVVCIDRDILPIKATDLREAARRGFQESFEIGRPDAVSEELWDTVFRNIWRTAR